MKGLLIVILLLTLLAPLGGRVAQAMDVEDEPSSDGQPGSGTGSTSTPTDTAPPSTVSITKNVYQFVDSGVLKNTTNGETQNNLFNNILKEKQGSIMTDISRLVTANLTNTSINGGLYTDSESLWDPRYDMQKWKKNTSPTTIYMESGNSAYKITIPPGNNGSSNQAVINNAISAVDKYKEMVKESVYVGLMSASYNIYSMIPDKQVPVANIIEQERVNGQLKKGYKIKSSGTGVKMTYSLKNYYHPISGKSDSATIGDNKESVKKYIETQYKSMVFDTGTSKEKIDFVVNADFSSFYSDITSNGGMYTKVDSSSVVTTNGVKSYTTNYNKKANVSQSLVDGTFPLALPSLFISNDTGYKISNKSGYVIDDKVSLLLSTSMVYKNSDGSGKEPVGDFESFGIDLNGIALVNLKVDKDGKPTDAKGATTIGVIVPLWFKETIANTTTETGELISDDIYFTGRTVKLNNNYNEKTRLDGTNKDLVAIDTKITGRIGIEVRRFAFLPDGDYKNRASHINIGTNPEKFKLQTHFESDPNADYRGFVMYRNNAYLDNDSQLVNWLKTEESTAMTDVKAETLLKLITGEIGLDDETLKYEDWVRMQEIKTELDVSVRDRVVSTMNIISIIMGYLIIVYSIFLCIAYWFDIVNVFVEFSLLKLVTGGRLYAIPNKDALDYITSSTHGENLRYVTFWNVCIIMLIGVFVGLIFIFVSPVVQFILWLYYLISDTMGVS